MAFFNEFPHTRTYDSDLGWLIKELKKVIDQLIATTEKTDDNAQDLTILKQQIEYIINQLQRPIEAWDAAIAYEAYTLVEYQGSVYMAIQDVPIGVGIGDTNYWTPSGNVLAIISQMQLDLNNQRADVDHLLELYNVISVADYGAVGDGVTNDRNSIAAAATAATSAGVPLSFEAGKTYFIDGNPIPIETSIDFNGATILMADDTSVCFEVGTDTGSQTIDMSTATAWNIGSDNSALYGKGFYLVTDVGMGNRSGGSANYYYYAQYLMTDGEGNFINSELPVGYGATHTATVYNLRDYEIDDIEIKDVKIQYQVESSEARPFIDVRRPHVIIENVQIDSPITSTTVQAHVIRCQNVCNIHIKNVYGTNVSLDASHSSYILLIYGCSDVFIEDLDTSSGWGNTGMSFVTNIEVNRANCNRLDIHYGHNGYLTFNNCICAGNLGVASIGMGYASITFNNCVWMGSSTDAWCVMYRNDFGMVARQVIFNGCKFRQRGVNSAVFQVNRPANQTEIANFEATLPMMDLTFNNCETDCTYWFNTTLNNDPVTPKINLRLINFTQLYNRRIAGNSNPLNSLTIDGMITTGTGLMHNQSIISTAAKIVRLLNSRINLAFGSGGIYDLVVEGCEIVASSNSSITGAAVIVGNIFAAGVTDRVTAGNGKESSGNVTRTA